MMWNYMCTSSHSWDQVLVFLLMVRPSMDNEMKPLNGRKMKLYCNVTRRSIDRSIVTDSWSRENAFFYLEVFFCYQPLLLLLLLVDYFFTQIPTFTDVSFTSHRSRQVLCRRGRSEVLPWRIIYFLWWERTIKWLVDDSIILLYSSRFHTGWCV